MTIENVKEAVIEGEVIADYSNDKPYPSLLSLYDEAGTPLHVVYAVNEAEKEYIIITAYIPSNQLWENNYKTRKK